MMKGPEIKIIFEDNHLLVVEKPPNILSQGDETGDLDMLTLLKQDIKVRYHKPGDVYLGLVHRLDRPVGGTMVFARTSKAASRLSDQIRRGNFKKTYLAVLHGSPAKTSDRLEDYLLKDERTNTVSVVSSTVPGAKKAILDYTVLEQREGMSLVGIHLHTGRPHQIRVQFSHRGTPLMGDQKYGNHRESTRSGIALWSFGIKLVHPTKNEEMAFQSMPPDTFPWNMYAVGELVRLIQPSG